jgi:hypothetical protein
MALVGHISGSTQSNSVIGVSGSVIIANRPSSLFPSLPGTDVTFFVSGSSSSGAATGIDRAVFGGDLVNSGTLLVKNPSTGTNSFSASTVGVSIGSTVSITLSTGNITTSGDIAVNGGDITTTSATATLFNANATNVAIGSSATALIIGSAAGTGTTTVNNNLIVSKNVTVTGDLTVNGTMATVNTTNLEVKDSVIGLGFASGTIAQTNGDRGWIGGLTTGGTNVMNKWDNTNSEFAFATTTSSATGSFAISSYSNLHTNDIQANIVSASLGFSGSLTRLMDGTSYMIAGSGISISSASNGAVTISSLVIGDVTGPGSSTQYAVALFDDTTGKVLRNSSLTTNGDTSLWIAADLGVSGSVALGDTTSDTVTFTARVNSDIIPSGDNAQNLGSATNRWANVYTGDLHLRNDRGDYTLIEEEDMLTIRFNKTGKRYKFLLEAVPHLDEDPQLKF